MAEHFIQKAAARMKAKGTEGKFGKATPKKIAAAKKQGGVRKKEAVSAENMKHIAQKRKHKNGNHEPHNAIGHHE
jgi:hypothetical protein